MVAVPTDTALTLPVASTVAMAALEELQVTVLSVASAGVTVATRVRVSPSTKAALVRLRLIPSTGITFFSTVTSQVAVFSPALAVMVAVPTDTALTLPVASTVAMAALEELQVTVLSVASAGVTVATRVRVSPSTKAALVRFRLIPSTGITFFSTVTSQVAVFSPALAVMVAVPTATAVTLPVASTVATAALAELQVTVLSVASAGVTVATRVRVSPSTSEAVVLSKVTAETGIKPTAASRAASKASY